MKKRLRIAVLMGGPSPERDVSMSTGRQIANALDPQRYSVLPVEITPDRRWLPRPDMLELPEKTGTGNREQGTEREEVLPIPYSLFPLPSTSATTWAACATWRCWRSWKRSEMFSGRAR